MTEQPKDILKQFISDLTAMVTKIMTENGVRADSDLISSVEFVVGDSGLQLLANDYYQYLSSGRKPKARKIPIEDLIVWVKKYNIGSGDVNSTAWAIQQSIYKNGIVGKQYEDRIEINVADMTADELAEVLSEIIADSMKKSFAPIDKSKSTSSL